MQSAICSLLYDIQISICEGHQPIEHILGAKAFKLKFGRIGGNYPIRI